MQGTLNPWVLGGGQVSAPQPGSWELAIPAVSHGYANAQIDDHRSRTRSDFLWKPPVRMSLRARTTLSEPQGTLGFGFWNDPFTLSIGQGGAARRLPASPCTAWFFYGSPPNDLRLTEALPGYGCKASVLKSPPVPGLLLAPAALAAIALAQIPGVRRGMLKMALGAVQAREQLVEAELTEWHAYELVWTKSAVVFSLDGEPIMTSDVTPGRPLGFVAWIDNQYAVASPEGGFRFGTIATESPQGLLLEDLEIEHLDAPEDSLLSATDRFQIPGKREAT